MERPRPLVAYFGHHKSASSWMERIARQVCLELRLHIEVVYDSEAFGHELGRFVRETRADFLAYSNAHWKHVQGLGPFRGVHLVRDPRDISVSAYFSHLHSHPTYAWPELVGHRERLRKVSKEEGLLLDMEFIRGHFEEMRSWKEPSEDVLELKMEEVTADPYRQVLRMFDFWGLLDPADYGAVQRTRDFAGKVARRVEHWTGHRISLPVGPSLLSAERLLGIVWQYSFERMSGGRRIGQQDETSHYRRGVAGDWRNHFTEEHVAYFKRHHNELLVRYGYETDDTWKPDELRVPVVGGPGEASPSAGPS